MSNQESYGKGWSQLNLMVNPESQEIHFIGGDLVDGVGDRPFKAAECIQFRKIKSGSENSIDNKQMVPCCDRCGAPGEMVWSCSELSCFKSV